MDVGESQSVRNIIIMYAGMLFGISIHNLRGNPYISLTSQLLIPIIIHFIVYFCVVFSHSFREDPPTRTRDKSRLLACQIAIELNHTYW